VARYVDTIRIKYSPGESNLAASIPAVPTETAHISSITASTYRYVAQLDDITTTRYLQHGRVDIMEPAHSSFFEDAIHVTPIDSHTYAAFLKKDWCIGVGARPFSFLFSAISQAVRDNSGPKSS
jgi:hypothetical protein